LRFNARIAWQSRIEHQRSNVNNVNNAPHFGHPCLNSIASEHHPWCVYDMTGGCEASQAANMEYVDEVAEAEAQGFRSAEWAAAMDTLDLEVFPGECGSEHTCLFLRSIHMGHLREHSSRSEVLEVR